MPTVREHRSMLVSQLPKRIREALISGDDVGLTEALGGLTEVEQVEVRDVIREWTALPQTLPMEPAEDGSPDPRDSPDLDLQRVDNLPSAPESLFRIVNGQEVHPPQEWLDSTHRADDALASVLFPVWYATTRKPKLASYPSNGFTGVRDQNACVHYGVARVFIPDSHEPGSLGSSWLKRWLWTFEDDRLALRRIEGRNDKEFWQQLRQQLQQLGAPWEDGPPPGDHVLLFVHGYNVSFSAAVVAAAQLGYDLAIPGITACFSWPSRGTYRGYHADEAACEPSVTALTSFMRQLIELVGHGRVHVLAHSMGNRLVLRALEQLVWEARLSQVPTPNQQLGHVILAAPDVDRDLFRLLAPHCPKAIAKQSNLYISRRDLPVSMSRWYHGYDRAGLHPPVTVVRGIATVDVSHVDISGHSSFRESRSVLRDITHVLHHDALPDDPRRALLPRGGGSYWQLG
jgi:esterase/lipase superfamily enzyme